jgi:hypothetical protein
MIRILLVTLIAATLTAIVMWEIQDPAPPELGETLRSPAALAVVLAVPANDRLVDAQGWLVTAQERPLFRVDRRPATAASDAVLKADGPARLTGVLTGPFYNRAIFMAAAGAKPVVVQEGERVADFVVRSIRPGRVTVVEANGVERTLQPSFAEEQSPPRE